MKGTSVTNNPETSVTLYLANTALWLLIPSALIGVICGSPIVVPLLSTIPSSLSTGRPGASSVLIRVIRGQIPQYRESSAPLCDLLRPFISCSRSDPVPAKPDQAKRCLNPLCLCAISPGEIQLGEVFQKDLFNLFCFVELIDRQSYILCNLSQQDRRYISSFMEWNGRCPAVCMTILLMGTPLAHFLELQLL